MNLIPLASITMTDINVWASIIHPQVKTARPLGSVLNPWYVPKCALLLHIRFRKISKNPYSHIVFFHLYICSSEHVLCSPLAGIGECVSISQSHLYAEILGMLYSVTCTSLCCLQTSFDVLIFYDLQKMLIWILCVSCSKNSQFLQSVF